MSDADSRRNRNKIIQGDVTGIPQKTLQDFASVFLYMCHPDGKGGDDLSTEKLSEESLGKILRAIEIRVDDKSVSAKDMLRETGGKDLDFQTYRDMMVARLKAQQPETVVRTQFEKFDERKTGKIPIKEMEAALRKGSRRPLKEAEMEKLLNIKGIQDQGSFVYGKFIVEFYGEKKGAGSETAEAS